MALFLTSGNSLYAASAEFKFSGSAEPIPRVEQQPSALVVLAFSVESTDTVLYVDSTIKLENSAMVKAQLRDGAQMTLRCLVMLDRLRMVLSNEKNSEKVLVFHLRHDPLTREFILYQEGQPPHRHKNLDVLIDSIWKVARIPLPLTTPLEKGEKYRLSLSLTLQHAQVPPWLEKALFFWSWDVVPPVMVTQEFTL